MGKLARPAGRLAGRADIPMEPTLARPAGRLAGRACPGAPRPTCRTSGGSGLSWSLSPDLPDVWRVGLVLQLLVRPAECLAGRVCPATPCKTCRTSGGSGLSRAPCPTCWTSGGPGLELLTNLVRRVGTGLTELLANRFAMQCNKKFNEMRSPVPGNCWSASLSCGCRLGRARIATGPCGRCTCQRDNPHTIPLSNCISCQGRTTCSSSEVAPRRPHTRLAVQSDALKCRSRQSCATYTVEIGSSIHM